MSQFPNQFGGARPINYQSRADSVSLAHFFNAVYAWMAAGLGLTAVVAWYVSNQPPQVLQKIFHGPVLLILFIAELALVVVIGRAINKISAGVATALFLLYSALNGLTMSAIFLVYTGSSIASTFIVAGGMFAAMSLYGMTTKRDLTKLGSLLFMALIGLIIASIVNIFWANSTLYWIISYAGVLIFVGLTAYDTQKLREIGYATSDNPALSARLSVTGSLVLYLDFINLFLMLLRIMGNRR